MGFSEDDAGNTPFHTEAVAVRRRPGPPPPPPLRTPPPPKGRPPGPGGGEARPPAIAWDDARVRVLLAFPDVYEIGMSHLGILLLREILSARPGTLCEHLKST